MHPMLLQFVAGTLAVAMGPLVAVSGGGSRGRAGVAAATVLPTVSLCLFASLAVHMQRSLGGWPETIGMNGFPPGLALHAELALTSFAVMILGAVFVCPIAVLLCAAAPRMRPGLLSVAVFALASGAVLAATRLAPEPFLAWWWD